METVRERILGAALILFAERGFSNSTSSALAKQAGIAEGTLFRHFKSKDAVLLELVVKVKEQLINDVTRYLAGQAPQNGLERVIITVQGFYTFASLNTPEFRDVRIAPQTYEPRRVSLGVVRSDDTTLLGIVDRAVGSLTEVERQAVINGNVLRERPVDLGELVHANPAIALAVASATCLIVVLFVLIILGLRARSNAKTAFDLKKRLRLYALCDDSFFEFDCRTKRLIISMPGKGQQGLSEPFAFECDAPAVFDEERKRSFAELLGGKEHRVEEVRMPDTDGIEHWLRVTVDPVEDASGRVAHTVGKIEVIDEERREKDQLVARAERDSLTGLLNSETTRLRIGQQLDALAGGERGALLVVDVDCFKDVNDTHGHLVGDLVLADIARILGISQRHVRRMANRRHDPRQKDMFD